MCFIILLIHPFCSCIFFYLWKRVKSSMKSSLWERMSTKALSLCVMYRPLLWSRMPTALCSSVLLCCHPRPILQVRTVDYIVFSSLCLEILACMHARLLQLYLTLCNPMDWGPPGSSVHGILQARILEWVAISFSKTHPGSTCRMVCSQSKGHSVEIYTCRQQAFFSHLLRGSAWTTSGHKSSPTHYSDQRMQGKAERRNVRQQSEINFVCIHKSL